MLDLLIDMEGLLSTNEDFLLGKWLHDARSWGESEKVGIANFYMLFFTKKLFIGI